MERFPSGEFTVKLGAEADWFSWKFETHKHPSIHVCFPLRENGVLFYSTDGTRPPFTEKNPPRVMPLAYMPKEFLVALLGCVTLHQRHLKERTQ